MKVAKTSVDLITNINQLINELDIAPRSSMSKIFSRVDIPPSEFHQYASWSLECYTRNCLIRTEKYELILICWDVNAETPIHGHGGQDCWVYQIQGNVRETRFEKENEELKELHNMVLTPRKLTYMHDRMGYHQLENISDERALTLHIYALPIDSCEVYDDEKSAFKVKNLKYDHCDLIKNPPQDN